MHTWLINSIHSVSMQISSLILMSVISANDEGVRPLADSLAPSYTAGLHIIIYTPLFVCDCIHVLSILVRTFFVFSDLQTECVFGLCYVSDKLSM